MNEKPEAVEVLRDNGWLSLTPPSFQALLLDHIAIAEFMPGDPIYRIGDPAGGLWGLVKGELAIEIPGSETGPHLAHFAIPGFWFGEGTVIYSSPRRVGVYATGKSTLASVSLATCHKLLQREPTGWRWIALLSTMTTDLALRLSADTLIRDPHMRTATVLLRLAGLRYGAFLASAPSPIRLNQEKIGNLVGLSKAAISPILRHMAKRGLINIRYRSIEVADPKGLAELLTR